MNAGILKSLRSDTMLTDLSDEELIARVEARLPTYLRSRALAKSPVALGLALLLAVAMLRSGSTQPTVASTPTTTVAPGSLTTTSLPAPMFSPPLDASSPELATDPSQPAPSDSGTGTGSPDGGDDDQPPSGPGPVDCDAQPLLDAAGPVLDTLKTTTGVLPAASTEILLANLTGCAPGDPPILLLGVLVELGSSLPQLGFDVPPPPVPFVQLPQSLLDALAPGWEALEPVCTEAELLPLIAMAGLEPYPGGMDDVALAAINQVISICSQLDPA